MSVTPSTTETLHDPLATVPAFELRVNWASDPKRMLDLFRRHLVVSRLEPMTITDCHVDRIRYRPGESRATITYSLQLQTNSAWKNSSQQVVVSGVLHVDKRATQLLKKLDRYIPQTIRVKQVPEADRTFYPFTAIEELDMFVQVFPFDRHLPHLVDASVGIPTDVLCPIESAFTVSHGGKWQIVAVSVEPIRYRVGLAAVLRHRVTAEEQFSSGAPQRVTRTFYMKILEPKQGERTYEQLDRLSRFLADRNSGLKSVRPITFDRKLGLLVLEEMSGVSWEHLLLTGRGIDVSHVIAERVAEFHQLDYSFPNTYDRTDRLDAWSRAFVRLSQSSAEKEVLTRLIREAETIPETIPKVAHRDMKIEHLLVDGDHLGLIDLDSAGMSDPVYDIAMMAVRLETLALNYPDRASHIEHAKTKLLNRYFQLVPLESSQGWRAKLCGARLEVAAGYYARCEEVWPQILEWLTKSTFTSECSVP